jgi:hypothetical protein
MENLKFISVLRTFSKKDMIDFEKYLVSPYFGCKQFAVNMFLQMKNYYPDFKQIDKHALFEYVFPSKAYNDSLFRKTISLLNRYASGFISASFTQDEPEWGFYKYINYARRRKLFKICERGINEFDKIQKTTEIHHDYFLYRYMVEREKVYYRLAAYSQKDACPAVVKRNEFLLLDFIIKIALAYREMDSNYKVFNYSFSGSVAGIFMNCFDFKKFVSGIQKNNEFRYIFEIAGLLIDMCNKPSDGNYFKFKDTIMKHYKKMHFSLSFTLFFILSSVSASRRREEQFEILKFMVEQEFFIKYGAYFQLKDFIVVLKSALRANDINWAENFLKKNIHYLNPDHIQNTLLYANALLCYHKKQFEKSLEYLSKVRYQLYTFKKDINVMALEIHYELGNFDTGLSLIDAYKHFLRKNRFVEETERNRYNSFISFYIRLFKAKINNDQIEKIALKKELERESSIVGTEWLLEKVNELI